MENRKLPSQEELNTIWRSLDPDLQDFRFEWSAKRTRTAGTIFYQQQLIILSVKHYLEFGMDEIVDTMKHEAAHYLAWIKHRSRGHREWFYYYLGMFGAKRHCATLSSNMKAKSIRLKPVKQKRYTEYDPITKSFRQFYQ